MGRYFTAEGFLNGIYVIFPLTSKLGRVVNNLKLVSMQALVIEFRAKLKISTVFYWVGEGGKGC